MKEYGKTTCFKAQVLELLRLHLTSSNASWWQLGIPDELTGKIQILFLVERTQNFKTMSMYMPSDCTQAWRGTLTCLFVHIQKSPTCLSLQFLRMRALALLCGWMSMPRSESWHFIPGCLDIKWCARSWAWLFSNQVVFRWKSLYKPNVCQPTTFLTMQISVTENKL